MSERHDFDWYGEQGRVATVCHETDKPAFSRLLGPDGNPLQYQQNPIGFAIPKGRPRDDRT